MQGTLYDSSGKPVLCKCGKEAGCAVIGLHSSVAWCSDCAPTKTEPFKFVYKPPGNINNAKLEKLKSILGENGDSWVLNVSGDSKT